MSQSPSEVDPILAADLADGDVFPVEDISLPGPGLPKMRGLTVAEMKLLASLGSGVDGSIQFATSGVLNSDAANLIWDNTAKSAAIGAGSVTASAILDLVSTTKGFLPPRMTSTQRNNIPSPAETLLIGDLTNHKIDFYNGTEWRGFISAPASTLTVGAIPFATASHEVDDDAGLTWNNAIKQLTVNGVTIDASGNMVLPGTLDVQGSVTKIDTINLTVADPLIVLAKGNPGTALDAGILIELVSPNSNPFWIWDASALEWAAGLTNDDGTTSGNIIIANYQPIRVGKVTVDNLVLDNDTLLIGGVEKLSSTTLGSGVVNSSLTSLGTLGGLTMSGTSTLELLQGARIKLSGGSGNNFIEGNVGNSGRLGIFMNNIESLIFELNGNIGVRKRPAAGVEFDVLGDIGVSGTVDGVDIAGSIDQDVRTTASPSFAQLSVDNLRLDGNILSSTDINGDIVLDPDGTGNVGIGTISPNDLLHVQGGRIRIQGTGSTYLSVQETSSGAESRFWTHTDGNLFIQNNNDFRFTTIGAGSTRMVINSDGNVGIGVIDPDTKLEINGQVKITGGVPGAAKRLTSDATGLATWENKNPTFVLEGISPFISYVTGDVADSESTLEGMIVLSFTTGSDVTTDQIIWEAGGTAVGTTFRISNGNFEIASGNSATIDISTPVLANTVYTSIIHVNAPGNTVHLYLRQTANRNIVDINDLIGSGTMGGNDWSGSDPLGIGAVGGTGAMLTGVAFTGTILDATLDFYSSGPNTTPSQGSETVGGLVETDNSQKPAQDVSTAIQFDAVSPGGSMQGIGFIPATNQTLFVMPFTGFLDVHANFHFERTSSGGIVNFWMWFEKDNMGDNVFVSIGYGRHKPLTSSEHDVSMITLSNVAVNSGDQIRVMQRTDGAIGDGVGLLHGTPGFMSPATVVGCALNLELKK